MSASTGGGGGMGKKFFKIQPRNTWEMISSAFNACVDLLDQPMRDDFINTANKGIIDPQSLGSIPLTLALYNELQSPQLKKYAFDAEEFLEGAKPALESYSQVLVEIMAKNKTAPDAVESVVDDDENTDVDNDKIHKMNKEVDEDAEPEEPLQMILTDESDAIIKKDPESLEARIFNMLTEPFFTSLKSSVNRWPSEVNDFPTLEVTNVTLVSARAVEVLPDSDDSEVDSRDAMEDDSFADEMEREYPIAAQIQVMYHYQVADEHEDDDNLTDEQVLTNLMISNAFSGKRIAIFEGWLRGDPDGHEDLKWKLAFDRHLY